MPELYVFFFLCIRFSYPLQLCQLKQKHKKMNGETKNNNNKKTIQYQIDSVDCRCRCVKKAMTF